MLFLKDLHASLNGKFIFFQNMLSRPKQTGAWGETPSKVLQQFNLQTNTRQNLIIELGVGTGKLTKLLLKNKKINKHNYIGIETNKNFNKYLNKTFTDLIFFDICASKIENIPTIKPADLILSTLPYMAFPKKDQLTMIKSISSNLTADGKFIFYYYISSLLSPVNKHFLTNLEKYFFIEKKIFIYSLIPSYVICLKLK